MKNQKPKSTQMTFLLPIKNEKTKETQMDCDKEKNVWRKSVVKDLKNSGYYKSK